MTIVQRTCKAIFVSHGFPAWIGDVAINSANPRVPCDSKGKVALV